jgi:hypothetical protein
MQGENHSVVCAWCNASVFGSRSAEHAAHGICVPCAVGFLKRLPPEYLRSVAEPDGAVTLFSGHRFLLSPEGQPLS